MAEVEAELIETPAGESDAVIVTLPEGETETPGSDAVEIARIEAEKEVTIAAIHADVATTEIEARAEGESERDERWHELQSQLANLTGQVASLSETVAALSILPALLPVAEVIAEPEPEPETETISTPPSTREETSETPTEVIDVSEAEKPEAPAPAKARLRFL